MIAARPAAEMSSPIADGEPSPSRAPRPGALGVSRLVWLLLVAGGLIVVAAIASLCIGRQNVSPGVALSALVHPAVTPAAVVVRDARLPRTVLALCVGAALGAAGATTQAVTRNPLGSPSVLGLVHGAALAVVATLSLFTPRPAGLALAAIVGTVVAAVIVFAIGGGSAGDSAPTRLVLGGIALSAVSLAGIEFLLVNDELSLDQSRRWLAGSLVDRPLDGIVPLLPLLLVGLVMALALAPSLDVLETGDEMASSLGLRVGATRLAAVAAICLLTAAAVAAAGPIIFVGLAVPHLARRLVGGEHRAVIPMSLVLGALLVVGADIVARVMPGSSSELPVGVVTAFVGGPVFVFIAGRRRWA